MEKANENRLLNGDEENERVEIDLNDQHNWLFMMIYIFFFLIFLYDGIFVLSCSVDWINTRRKLAFHHSDFSLLSFMLIIYYLLIVYAPHI